MKYVRVVMAAVAAFVAVPRAAQADAIPGPVDTCAKNEELVHDHDGQRCLPTSCPPGKVLASVGGKDRACVGPAPTNCPPGWKGEPGPHCSPDLCNGEVKTCGAGKTCRPSPICAVDKDERLGRAYSPTRTYTQGCDAQNACGAGESCRTVRTCLSAGIERLAVKPSNALAVRLISIEIPKTETPYKGPKGPQPPGIVEPTPVPAATVVDASAPSSLPPAALPPAATGTDAGTPTSPPAVAPKSGRSGCTTSPGSVPSSSPVLALAAAMVGLFAARRRRRAGAVVGGLALGSFGSIAVARADVVPPPSVICGKNEKVVVDHGGGHCEPTSCSGGKVIASPGGGFPRCVDPAPKNCPAGWVGVPGPHCQLALCDEAAPCAAGSTCREAPICTSEGRGFSEIEPGERASRTALAAPRAPMPYRLYAGACDAQLACAGGETCRSVKVCLPSGADRPATNAEHVLAKKRFGALPDGEKPMGGAKPTTSSSAPPVAPETPSIVDASTVAPAVPKTGDPPAPVPPQPGRGTAGCAAAPATDGGGVLALVAVLGAALARRARREDA